MVRRRAARAARSGKEADLPASTSRDGLSSPLEGDLALERLKRTFECAPVGVAFVDPSGILIDVNPAFCAMLGHERGGLCGRTFQELTHPDDVAANVALLEQLSAGAIGGYRMQKRYLRANGDLLWADLTVSVLKDQNGRVLNLISIIVDIGEAKQQEERLNFLLRELGHRSKNLLAVVRATAHRIAASATSVAAMLAGLDDRLTGLAASQELLVGNGGAVDLAELVRNQISAFVPLNDARLEIAGPDVAVGPNAANTIGMALHELATNACKYGALSVTAGRIQIRWELQAGELRVSWLERGGPAVSPPSHKGFGRTVIERAAERLGGETVLSFEPAGVAWRLRAPESGLAL